MPGPADVLRLWFHLDSPVARRPYLATGVGLLLLKLAGDSYLAYAMTDAWVPPHELLRVTALAAELPDGLVRLLVLWALPFAWIGLTMSVRRAVDAGLSPWLGLGFALPYLNLVTVVALCVLPSRPLDDAAHRAWLADRSPAMVAVALGLGVALALMGVGVLLVGDYGLALFVGGPFAVTFVSAARFNQPVRRSIKATIGLSLATLLAAGAVLLLFALEGLICLLMALPLALPLGVAGALAGRASVDMARGAGPTTTVMLAVPLLALVEPGVRPAPEPRLVTTTVEVAAPAEIVWERVIAFPPIAPPDELLFRAGIAYPVGAHIEGRGVGAVRTCEFDTGAFVEPITHWEPPVRLAFDVVDQPHPMTELSPASRVAAPHLDGAMRSERGEFRLVPLADGRTRLEGRTWYTLDMWPQAYWQRLADPIVGAIHERVLRHVGALAEADARALSPAP